MALSPVPDLTLPGRPARVAAAITILLVLVQVIRGYSRLGAGLGDTDDAVRLVLMRSLIEGEGWFGGWLGRLQPPAGLDMHWSRLIDGGLAALYGLLAVFLPPETAETWTRLIWPLLFIFPLALGAVLAARRLGGSTAVLAAAIFIACLPVIIQFAVGRIDHHNAQMALAMLMLAGAVSLERRWGAWLAGISGGLMLAIGLEALVFAALAGAAIAFRYVADERLAPAARHYAVSLGVTVPAAFLVQTPPRLWSATACDMLSVNLVVAIAAACGGLLLATLVRGRALHRLAAVMAAGLAGGLLYIALDPACLGGPYAHMDPRLRPYWLDHVLEVQTWPKLLHTNPVAAATLAAPVFMALGALALLVRRHALWRDPAWLTVIAVFAASVISGLYMVRMLSYGAAFGAVVLAGAFAHLVPRRIGGTFVGATLTALAISPAVVTSLAALAAGVWQASPDPTKAEAASCRESRSYAPLTALAPGLFLADIDFGPHLLAHTHHSTLAAPYHRMNEGIATAHHIWAAPPEDAARMLRARDVTYVMLCPARGKLPVSFPDTSLRRRLEAKDVPDFLEPVPAGDVFRVWRVR